MNTDQILCCKTADIILNEGKITFGNGCIIHPKAKIIVEGDCSIIFGDYNIIEENVLIKATPKFNPIINNNETITMYIGCFNHFKVGSVIENTSIENYNIFDYRCKIEDAYIESKCIITPSINIPRTTIKSGSIVLDNQIIVSNNQFNEADFRTSIKELYKTLSILLPKQNTMQNVNII